jgi:hypothetical protein
MKTIILKSKKILALTSFSASVLLASLAQAEPTTTPGPQVQTSKVVVSSTGADANDSALPPGANVSRQSIIRLESIEPGQGKEPAREVTWLGVSTEEVPEALASQLELKSGQGLVVIFVAPDSPAAKAGIQKYDVIEALGDQMLVDPAQLRKLVQMQKEGDAVKLTLHRGGKKQTVSATLAKRTERFSLSAEPSRIGELAELAPLGAAGNHRGIENHNATVTFAGMDKKMVNAEVQFQMEAARQAIQEALRQSAQAGRAERHVAPVAPPVPPLPPMVDVGNNATVTVTKDGASVKTVVKSDETGILVILASPKKHLTAHDANGKLLFDGEIESTEQQQKVPAELWEKVKPLLQQIQPAEKDEPAPHARSEGEQKSETQPEAGLLVSW